MEEKKYTYSNVEEISSGQAEPQYKTNEKTSKTPSWIKAIIIILVIGLVIIAICRSCSNSIVDKLYKSVFGSGYQGGEVSINCNHDYIATIYIQGEINEASTGAYYHQFILNAIDALEEDDHNKGIILWVNTPGGSVFASDELYLKLCEYQEETNRPLYASFQSQATSGGYYISANADKIIANRNCWTGSIGVTIGEFFDVTELLDNMGVKVTTITAGENKAMGSYFIEMTEEQREILQSLIDDSYEQFTNIVAEGRNMDIETVKKIADGRVYTAAQALENGLIDEIGTYEDTIDLMKEDLGIDELSVVEFVTSDNAFDLSSLLGKSAEKNSQVGEIEELLSLNNKFEVSYKSVIVK